MRSSPLSCMGRHSRLAAGVLVKIGERGRSEVPAAPWRWDWGAGFGQTCCYWPSKISPSSGAVVLWQSAFTRCYDTPTWKSLTLRICAVTHLKLLEIKPFPVIVLARFHSSLQNASRISERSRHLLIHPVAVLKPDMGQMRQRLTQCIPFPGLSASAMARSARLPARAELIRGRLRDRQIDSSQFSRGRNRLCPSCWVPDNRNFQLREECRN